MTPLTVQIDDPRAADPRLAGTKMAALAALRQAGLPVPDGFVLTTEASAGQPGTAVTAALEAAYAALCRRAGSPALAVAVRSSATTEDLPGRSAAGIYRTELNVVGAAALLAAVERCWASAASPAASSYWRERAGETRMALGVLPMLRPAAAGVVSSVDPVSGDEDTAVVEAVPGLGDALVSGTATPEHHTVDRPRRAVRDSCPGDHGTVLTPAALIRLLDLLERVEAVLSRPVELEWALPALDVAPTLLQARPLTGLPGSTGRAGQ